LIFALPKSPLKNYFPISFPCGESPKGERGWGFRGVSHCKGKIFSLKIELCGVFFCAVVSNNGKNDIFFENMHRKIKKFISLQNQILI